MLPTVLHWLCLMPEEQTISNKIPLSVAQIPFVFPYVLKSQKAKHLVSFWSAKGNVLAMKSEPLMQHDEMESST